MSSFAPCQACASWDRGNSAQTVSVRDGLTVGSFACQAVALTKCLVQVQYSASIALKVLADSVHDFIELQEVVRPACAVIGMQNTQPRVMP